MDTTSARSHKSVMDQVESVIHQYLKRYGTLEGMKKDVFVDPMYYQQWTTAVKAPFAERVRPPEIDMFLSDIHDGFIYVQQLLSSRVSDDRSQNTSALSASAHPLKALKTSTLFSEITLEDPSTLNFNHQEPADASEEEYVEGDDEDGELEEDYEEDYEDEDQRPAPTKLPQKAAQNVKPFSAMSVDDQLSVRASTVCQVLEPFVGSSLMSGLEFLPNRVVPLLPGLLENRPAAESEDFATAVWCLTQMMAYLGVHSIEADLTVISFDAHGNPVRYNVGDANFPIGELYAKWR